jgi:protein N-terminal amidase
MRYLPGYVFDSAEAILPYLELPHTGPTSEFCKELANRLSCYVVAGYPERLNPHEAHIRANGVSVAGEMEIPPTTTARSSISVSPVRHAQKQVGANSAVLYSPSGECVLGYRKTHMFETDVTWAKPGKSLFRVIVKA